MQIVTLQSELCSYSCQSHRDPTVVGALEDGRRLNGSESVEGKYAKTLGRKASWVLAVCSCGAFLALASCSLLLFSPFFPPSLFYGFMSLTCLCITHLGASFSVINILLACLFQVLCSECVLCQLFIGFIEFYLFGEGRLLYYFPCMLLIMHLLWFCFAAWHKQN